MSEELNTPTQETPATEAEAPAPAPRKKVNIKELMSSSLLDEINLLQKDKLTLPLKDDTDLEITVRQLTKREYDAYNKRVSRSMPVVPLIEQHYTVARRNPVTGEIKPAGVYREPNPQDAGYLQESQDWFNESCVWFCIFAAGDDFELDVNKPEEELDQDLQKIYNWLAEKFPTPSILELSYAAARVNRGIHVAEQLIGAVDKQRNQAELRELISELNAGVTELDGVITPGT